MLKKYMSLLAEENRILKNYKHLKEQKLRKERNY